jgi:hypothetical protein
VTYIYIEGFFQISALKNVIEIYILLVVIILVHVDEDPYLDLGIYGSLSGDIALEHFELHCC